MVPPLSCIYTDKKITGTIALNVLIPLKLSEATLEAKFFTKEQYNKDFSPVTRTVGLFSEAMIASFHHPLN